MTWYKNDKKLKVKKKSKKKMKMDWDMDEDVYYLEIAEVTCCRNFKIYFQVFLPCMHSYSALGLQNSNDKLSFLSVQKKYI